MKYFKSILLVLAVLLVASAANATTGTWQKGGEDAAQDGTGTDLSDPYSCGKAANATSYLFVPAQDATDSTSFIIPNGYVGNLAFNANTAGTGTNTITANLILVADPADTIDADNAHIVQGAALTGAGTRGRILNIGEGMYWVDIIAAGPSAKPSLFTLICHKAY